MRNLCVVCRWRVLSPLKISLSLYLLFFTCTAFGQVKRERILFNGGWRFYTSTNQHTDSLIYDVRPTDDAVVDVKEVHSL